MKRLLQWTTGIVLLATASVAGFAYWHYTEINPNTDDAYVQANMVYIAPQVTGIVSDVPVKNNQVVQKGQVLFHIDTKPFELAKAHAQTQLALAQQSKRADEDAVRVAQAKVAQASASLEATTKISHRVLTLSRQGRVSKTDGDQAKANQEIAEADVNAAKSQLAQARQRLGKGGENPAVNAAKVLLKQAELNLSYTTIAAPKSGIMSNVTLRDGSVVKAGQPLFALIDPSHWWIDANYKETDLKRIRVGQKATIKVDIYPGRIWHGVVESISSGSGSTFSLLPAENATGNWVKVTQRFTVRVKIIDPTSHYPLRIGASADVTIHTQP